MQFSIFLVRQHTLIYSSQFDLSETLSNWLIILDIKSYLISSNTNTNTNSCTLVMHVYIKVPFKVKKIRYDNIII